jgi:hypothetical protein
MTVAMRGTTTAPRSRWLAAAALALATSTSACQHRTDGAPTAAKAPAPAAPPVAAALDAEPALVEEAPEADPTSEIVKIKLIADPARKAHVYWGRKDLGLAPLEVTRPRGSGPLDLVVVTPGALTLHTRVFTDRDDRLALRLIAAEDAPTMLGYRADDDPALAPAKAPQKPLAKGPKRALVKGADVRGVPRPPADP